MIRTDDSPGSSGGPLPLCRACRARLDAASIALRRGFTGKVCPACRSILVHPLPTEKDVAALYNDRGYYGPSPETDKSGYKTDYLGFQKSRALEYSHLLSWIETRAPKRLLIELGCAFGVFMGAARERGWKTLGIELSSEAAAYARERLNLEVLNGDIARLSEVATPPSAIVMLDLLEHLRSPDKALQQCHDRLEPDGILAIRTPDAGSPTALRSGATWAQITPPDHLTLYSRSGLYDALRRQGFEPVAWRRAGGLGIGRHLACPAGSPRGSMSARGLSQHPVLYNLARWVARPLDRGDMMEVLARKTDRFKRGYSS